MRRAVTARGARHVSLPGLRLAALPATAALGAALACPALVFTSPAAVLFAARQQPLLVASGSTVFAVGAGTAGALLRQGIRAWAPAADAMHSEGLLGLPQWSGIEGPIGLVTAPGGRGIIAAGLADRGLAVQRAEVYRRLPPRFSTRHLAALHAAPGARAVLVSSGEALDATLDALPEDARTHLRMALAVVSSARLAEAARAHGFRDILPAPAPTAGAMLDALARHAATLGFR